MLSTWLTWLLIAAIPVAAVVLRLWAGNDPRNDEPPDSSEDERPGQAALPLAA